MGRTESVVLSDGVDFPVTLSPAGHAWLQEDPEARGEEVLKVALDFRHFLKYWRFVNQDTGQVQTLGDGLWDAQEEFARVCDQHDWVFYLKARQLGETTIECAYDAWVARFRDGGRNARVHIFSKREKEAQSLLERVKYGLENLPYWMHFPVEKDTLNELQLRGDEDDLRHLVAYPADNDTARGETCNHAHMDEWAFATNPKRVWQSIEPSAAGTVHIITTGQGPQNYSSTFWRKTITGDVKDRRGEKMYPCFIGALNRPDRTESWLRAKKAGMDEETFRWEYPMRWEDALSGAGGYVFKGVEIDAASVDAYGLQPFEKGRKYIKAWDIGRHQDAAVGIVLDVTEDVFDVVHYVRLVNNPYPSIQREIKVVHELYPGSLTVIEDNAAGEAVRENLDVPEHQVIGFKTTKPSKERIIAQLRLYLQQQMLKWRADECPELDAEMRGYQLPDDDVRQDSVMTLAIALDHADKAYRTGRVLAVAQV